VGLYVAVMAAALGTVLLLPAFAPVVETAQASAAALF
jgi:NADH-quinone oxidoreductase subunit N